MSDTQATSRYGNYEVLARPDGTAERLGGGSFGETFKARHVFLDQVVALKVINEKFAHDATAKERFLREARVVHGLRHAHIAQIMDFGEAHGTLYYAMEYCPGGSLEDLVRRVGPLDPATVELLACQLAAALECSHRAGFIHRDVKPANVMLADGDALALKLVDFGLVKPLAAGDERMASLTLDGQNFFTPLFASPEQVLEEELDVRSDLFSLGMTLWFLLKGATPESGSTAMVMAKRLSADSYRAQLPATLPPRLRAVLRKLLEKDKVRRFATAAAVLAALASDEPLPEAEADPVETPPSAPTTVPDADDPSMTIAFEPAAGPVRLADKYRLVEKTGRSTLGNLYRADRADDGAMLFVTVLDDALREDAARMERLHVAVTAATHCTHDALCQVYGLERFEDAEVLVREWNGGVSLQSVVKARGSIPFTEALAPLRTVAAGVDAAAAAGMGGVRLTPDEIFLQPADGTPAFADEAALLATPLSRWPPFRLRLTPILLEDELVAQDVSMTFSEGTGGSPRVEFGSLLYRLVAGMQVKFAARVNRGSYIRTAGLSEEGNRVLSGCIVDEAGAPADCSGLLAALERAEGLGDGGPRTALAPQPPGTTTRPPGAEPAAATQRTREKLSPAAPPPASSTLPLPPGPPPLPLPSYAPTSVPVGSLPSSPLVPILIGLGVAACVLGAAAFVLLRPRPAPDDPGRTALSSATPAPTAEASVAPGGTPSTPTPASAAPSTVALRGAAGLSAAATFELAGRPATPTRRGDDLVFTLDPAAGASADLVVKVPGYRPVRLSVGAGGSAALPAALAREVLPVFVTFRSRETDYAFIAFSFTGTLPGENVQAPDDLTYSLRNIASPARIELPTGKYVCTFYGSGQGQDTRILPLVNTVTVKAPGRIEVPVPASFAGRFRGEFDDEKTRVHVVRTITLQPGLAAGTCDEEYFVDGKLNERSVDGVPLAEVRLDADGVLRAHIRYALYRHPAARTYDEVFELRRNPVGALVMTGGRETMPDDPVLRSELERKLRDQPPSPANRPGETVLRPVE